MYLTIHIDTLRRITKARTLEAVWAEMGLKRMTSLWYAYPSEILGDYEQWRGLGVNAYMLLVKLDPLTRDRVRLNQQTVWEALEPDAVKFLKSYDWTVVHHNQRTDRNLERCVLANLGVVFRHRLHQYAVTRGRDLFIKGMGGFNIQEALDKTCAHGWLPALPTVQGYGYGLPSTWLSRRYLKYTIRWHEQLLEDKDLLDYFLMLRYMEGLHRNHASFIDLHPLTLNHRAHDWEAEQRAEHKVSRQYNGAYYKEGQPDSINGLKLVMNTSEIVWLGNAAHHCVAGYQFPVLKGDSVILYDPETLTTGEYSSKGGQWIQIRAKYNGNPPTEVLAKFLQQDVETFAKEASKRVLKIVTH